MLASELLKIVHPEVEGRVARDAEVLSLGYLTHKVNHEKMLSFVGARKFMQFANGNRFLSCAVVPAELADSVDETLGLIVTAEPSRFFYEAHKKLCALSFYWYDFENDIDPSVVIHPSAVIAGRNVRIGAGTRIGPGVILNERTIIGRNCIIGPGTILSSEGFEYKRAGDGFELIEHGSGVEIGDDVYIHANCVVDRGLYRLPTAIGSGTKIDNTVHVAHGVRIGRNCLITAGVVFAAAVIVGDGARIDPNATIAHECEIGEGAYVSLGSVVVEDVPAGQKYTGNFAMPHMNFLRRLKR